MLGAYLSRPNPSSKKKQDLDLVLIFNQILIVKKYKGDKNTVSKLLRSFHPIAIIS